MKKLLVTLMCVVMVMAMMPVMAFAESADAVKNEADFRAAVANGGVVELGADIVLTTADDAGRDAAVSVDKAVEIVGNGHSITTARTTAFKVNADFKLTDVKVYASKRCIDTRTKVDLVLDKVLLEATHPSETTQPLTVGGNTSTALNITVKDSEIKATNSGYGIITFNPIKMNMVNSKVSGYCAIYFKGEYFYHDLAVNNDKDDNGAYGARGSVLNIKDSSFAKSVNVHSGESNAFGTIVFEDGNITVNIDNSKVAGKCEGNQYQVIFLQSDSHADFKNLAANTVNIYNGSVIEADSSKDLATVSSVAPGKNNIVFKDATCNVEIPKEFVASGYVAKKAASGLWVVENDVEVKVEDVPTVDATKPVEKVEVGTTTATKEVLAETSQAVVDAVVKGEEVKNVDEKVVTAIQNAIDDGKAVDVSTTVVAKPVEEKAVAEADVKLVAKTADGSTVVQYLDLSVLMTVKAEGQADVTGEVKELADEVTFTIAVPKELKDVKEGYAREYYVIRVHEGKVDKLPVTVNADGTLSFKTDRFSTYALAYTDTAVKTEAPKTGDTNTMMPWLVVMAVVACGAVVFRRKEN